MTKEIWQVILTSSVVSTLITVILSPFIHWFIDKKKIRVNNHIKLISEARAILKRNDFSRSLFINSGPYNRLRCLFSKELEKKIRSPETIEIELSELGGVFSAGDDLLRQQIHKELNGIEKKWGLI